MVNRRGFLGLLGAFAASAALDPERALWVRGAKLVSIPKPAALVTTGWAPSPWLKVGDVVTFTGPDGKRWPERFIVTEEAQSRADFGKARFRGEGSGRFQRPYDTVFKEMHLCHVNGPSHRINQQLLTLTPEALKPSMRQAR